MGFLSKARGALTSLDNTLTTVLHTAAPIIETLANVADTGIFDNVPVVSNILNVAAFVQGHVDKLTDTDAAMNAVNAYMCLVAQTIERVITVPGVEERVGLQSAIEHVDEIVTDIKDHVVAYVGKHTSCKIGEEFINTFKLGEQDLDETVFVDDLVQLQQALEALQVRRSDISERPAPSQRRERYCCAASARPATPSFTRVCGLCSHVFVAPSSPSRARLSRS